MDNPDPTQFITILAHKAALVAQQSAFDSVVAAKSAEFASPLESANTQIATLTADLAAAQEAVVSVGELTSQITALQAQVVALTPPPVPTTIRAWQAKAVLQLAGLLDKAESIIDGLEEPQRTVVLSAWTNNADFTRTSPTIAALGAALGLTEEQLDGMFAQAAALTV